MSIDKYHFVKGNVVHDLIVEVDPPKEPFKHAVYGMVGGVEHLWIYDNPAQAVADFERWRRQPCEYITLTLDGEAQPGGRLPLVKQTLALEHYIECRAGLTDCLNHCWDDPEDGSGNPCDEYFRLNEIDKEQGPKGDRPYHCDLCGAAIPTGHEELSENDGELYNYCGECGTPEEFAEEAD